MSAKKNSIAAGDYLIMMYHYIRPIYSGKGIFGLTPEMFENQVRQLSHDYDVMDPMEYCSRLEEGLPIPSKTCLLSFDDGLADHYQYVYPVLLKYKIRGMFFLVTDAIENGRIPDVHKIHLLNEKLGNQKFFGILNGELQRFGCAQTMETSKDEIRQRYRWDDDGVAVCKYFLNYILDKQRRHVLLNNLFEKYIGKEEEHAVQFYMGWEKAREMEENGMVFGCHGHAHHMYSRMGITEQIIDLDTNCSILRSRLQRAVKIFSYPYGKKASFNDETVDLLKKRGFLCAFANIPGFNNSSTDRFRLFRLDPKDIYT